MLKSNSKTINFGDIFIAIGDKAHNFIPDAIHNGASKILYSDDKYLPNEEYIEYIKFEKYNPTDLYKILDQYYKKSDNIIVVTGTNGKTSVCFIAAQLASFVFGVAGYIGTIGIIIFENGKIIFQKQSDLTTPDVVTLHGMLHNLYLNGINYVFLEASSIGIEQGRIGGLNIKIACFTNFTQDHLDYHNTMEEYFVAKSKLFSEFSNQGTTAILNADDEYSYTRLTMICQNCQIRNIIDYGKNAKNEVARLDNYKATLDGLIINDIIKLSLYGSFQVYNFLCVIAILHALGVKTNDMSQYFEHLCSPGGRLEKVLNDKKLNIFVDYAHTPDAISKALLSLKEIKPLDCKLIIIFGCGGNRDTTKRSIMGRIASSIADYVIITDDNPRLENAQIIRLDIISGCRDNFIEIADRAEAINYGIKLISENDILLIAGKGHENYQIIGDQKIYFSDFDCIRISLNTK